MLSVELTYLADILDATHQAKNISQSARTWSKRISDAIWNTTVNRLAPITTYSLTRSVACEQHFCLRDQW